ncbi:uncharacterized protein KY384_007087 [Bacidia gigantensis]|uniref:uncharacterized protein n=1 Tax=Bacidia gigantensis TaxID=2732470 RepID=UPI001D04C6B8|nr:uncharacterized protein KY384_007087 [Bacidia gigantensis]KAG8528170.1 hypothetical protein KY384_007087 [Bacidia gigantensis]
MSPPTVDKFLGEISHIIQQKNGVQLQDYLVIEPPLPELYKQIVNELRQAYPNTSSHEALENKIKSFIPENDDGENDVNVENLLETHDMLKGLLKYMTLSFMGVTVLPTVISLSRMLARLAIGLDKRPDLIADLTRRESVGGEEAVERVTLVEGSANVIREAFKKCLSERSGGPSGTDASGKPEGRRIGIYLTANLCLKLFFHCKKLRSAEQIFGNIYQQSPPLALFPASQRVTYLYYLGRYLFANNHFYRAQLALQAAYDQCYKQSLSQRRSILIYLITSNIILGRFPSPVLWQQQVALGLQEKFQPICTAIAKGDLASFRKLTNVESEQASWFLQKRILIQISNRCEIQVWRSLARRTFLLSGSIGDAANKIAPTMGLQDMLTLAVYLEKKALDQQQIGLETSSFVNGGPGQAKHTNSIFMVGNNTNDNQQRSARTGYVDPDLERAIELEPSLLPTLELVESIAASMVEQDLLHGFLSHSSHRFAITGAKSAAPLQVGFPKVWDVIKAKANMEVPGWVKEDKNAPSAMPGRFGPGMVVNLSGARPAGAAAG